jgi:hypothetical protein
MVMSSINPDTEFKLSLNKLILLIIFTAGVCFTLGGTYYGISSDIGMIKTRLSNIEITLDKIRSTQNAH